MGIIGQPIDRRDGRAKVTGAAKYAAEFQQPNMAYAVLVQSTIPNGEILAIDTAPALALPGVLAVITPDNALRLDVKPHTPMTVVAPLLQDRTVRYNGSHVAVAVADTQDRAFEAASAVRVTYRAAPAVTTMDAALDQAVPPKKFRGGERPPDSRRGDPDQAFAAAPVQLRETYRTPIEHHNPMELHATVASWEGDDKLTVWHATQGVVGARDTLAGLFGLRPENVRVIDPYVGGGFGTKGNAWPPMTLAAMAAKMVRRPVRLELTRAQMFTSNGYRPRTVQTVQIGADRDGTLVSLRHDGSSQNSRPELGEFSEPFALASEVLYSVPNNAVSHRLVQVNHGLPTYMRAPGEAPGMFALESAMDELAVKLAMDPLALRLKNHADTDEHEGKPFSAKKLLDCYRQGAEAFGWDRRPAVRSMRDGGWLVGWGMATSTYPMNRRPASALVVLRGDGSVLVQAATQDVGTGTYTVLAQVAAEVLGIPVTRVRVEIGDSALPKAPVSGGSMTLASVGPAVQAAATEVRDRLFAMAASLWHRAGTAGLRLSGGVVIGQDGRVSVAELLARSGQDSLAAEAKSDPAGIKDKHSLHSFGAQFAEVRVNEDTGEIRVARWVGAFDVGRIINAKTARSQAIGGITFGIGMALLEETTTDVATGRYTNRNVAEYLMPVNADIPDIKTIFVDNEDPVSNSLGARGLGELPMVGVPAAIANAVFHATSKRLRDLPIRPEHLLA